jgi:arylsulfatase
VLARQMEVFAGFLSHTDHEIGRLVEAIRNGPNGNDTVIIYIVGDNGGSVAGGMHGATDPVKAPLARQAEDMQELGGPRHDNGYAIPWAWAGSTRFKGMKFVASDLGAIRNPLVISWPQGITAKGRDTDALCSCCGRSPHDLRNRRHRCSTRD